LSRKPGSATRAIPAAGRGAGLKVLFLIFAAEGSVLVLFWFLGSIYAAPPRLIGFDAVALPGEEARLEARLDQDLPSHLRHRVEGLSVHFWRLREPPAQLEAGSEPLGSALTGRDGATSFSVTAPEEPGVHRFRLVVESLEQERGVPLAAELILQVLPADKPLVIIGVPAALEGPFRAGEAASHPPPSAREGASRVLGTLAQRHGLIYASFRPDHRPWRTRRSLDESGFPAGALLWPEDASRSDELQQIVFADFLRRRITSRWKTIPWAFAAGTGEVQALARLGIRTVQLGSLAAARFGPRELVIPALDWKAAEGIIQGH
jgi:hypothetical protein